MEIDPSISYAPYVPVGDMGYSDAEEQEILFSMHTVFRIGEMHETDDRLWEVNLTLNSDDDPQLKSLTDYIREEIGVENPWYRMGLLMLQIGKFEKALEIFRILLETTFDENRDIEHLVQTAIIDCIGRAHKFMGDYSNALLHLGRAFENC
jgi:tetratricopeptide (TPR) repeat protein